MVTNDEEICPDCGGDLKYYDRVRRIVRTRNGESYWVKLRRLRCHKCKAIHRELPEHLLPYRHYEAEIIRGFLSGEITSFDLNYEDYPCETTVKEWKSAHEKHLLL